MEANFWKCCPVCKEDYTEEGGEKVLRLLPCSHTVCSRCIPGLLGGGQKLRCPECRHCHRTENKGQNFCQNRYILEHLKETRGPVCEEHQKIVILFCKDCQKFIFEVCLLKEHKKHEYISVDEEKERQEEEKEEQLKKKWVELTRRKEKLKKRLPAESLFSMGIHANLKNTLTLEHLEKRKQRCLALFDEQIRKIRSIKGEIEDVLSTESEQVEKLWSLGGGDGTESDQEEFSETLTEIETYFNERGSRQQMFKFFDHEGGMLVEKGMKPMFSGKLVK